MKKLKMVEKDGQKVPFYAADGKGKMMGGGKVMGYKEGDMVELPVIKAKKGKIKRKPTAKEKEEGFKGTDIPDEKVVKKMGGGMMRKKGFAKGGKVRGSGIAKQGVRAAKMVIMKGS